MRRCRMALIPGMRCQLSSLWAASRVRQSAWLFAEKRTARTRDAVEKVSHRSEYSRSVVSKSDFLSPSGWPDPAIRPAEQPSDRVLSCLLYQVSRSHQIISRCSEFQQPLYPFSSSQLDFAQ